MSFAFLFYQTGRLPHDEHKMMVNWAISAVELGCGSAAEKTVTHTTAVTLSRQGELRHFRAEEKDKWLDDALLFSREREKVTMVVNIELSDNAMFIVAL